MGFLVFVVRGSGLRFGVWGYRGGQFGVRCLGLRVGFWVFRCRGLRLQVRGVGSGVSGFAMAVWGSRFRGFRGSVFNRSGFSGSWFRVSLFRVLRFVVWVGASGFSNVEVWGSGCRSSRRWDPGLGVRALGFSRFGVSWSWGSRFRVLGSRLWLFEVVVVRGLWSGFGVFEVCASGFPRFGVCASELLVGGGGSRFSRFGVAG